MYRVRLDQFEGPLDLLLFFIRRDELDIHDIPIARIADEYLAYVRLLEQIDLDGAADFIYMAALLIQIKARMILPHPEEEGEEGDAEDPRKALVERLLEYMRFKEAADVLDRQWADRHRHFTRGAAPEGPELRLDPRDVTYRVSLFDLVTVLRTLSEREPVEEAPRHTPRRYAYAIEDLRRYVLQGAAAGPASFRALVAGRPKPFIIVAFLAVLDLLQQQAVRLHFGLRAEDFSVEAVAPPPAAAGERVREITVDRTATLTPSA